MHFDLKVWKFASIQCGNNVSITSDVWFVGNYHVHNCMLQNCVFKNPSVSIENASNSKVKLSLKSDKSIFGDAAVQEVIEDLTPWYLQWQFEVMMRQKGQVCSFTSMQRLLPHHFQLWQSSSQLRSEHFSRDCFFFSIFCPNWKGEKIGTCRNILTYKYKIFFHTLGFDIRQ